MSLGLDLCAWASIKLFKGYIATFNGMVGIQYQNAISGRINQCVQPALFVTYLGVKLCIEDSNSGLISEGLQKQLIV